MATMENLKAAHNTLRDETARAGQGQPADKAEAGRKEVEALRAEIDACGNDQVKIDAVYGKVEAARAKLNAPQTVPTPSAPPTPAAPRHEPKSTAFHPKNPGAPDPRNPAA